MAREPDLTGLLAQLEQRLTASGAPVVRHLQPGADPQRIEAMLLERGVTPSEELVAWWTWHDGTDVAQAYGGAFVPLPENLLLANWHLPTLAEAAAEYDDLQLAWDGALPRGWWPVVLMSVPAVLCADTAGDGQLFLVDGHAELPSDPPVPFAESLTAFVQLLTNLFDVGAVVPASPADGGLTLDHSRLPTTLPWPAYW